MLKKLILTAVAICLTVCLSCVNSTETFIHGQKTYYLYSQSSQAKITQTKPFLNLNLVGESSVVSASEFNLESFIKDYNAKILFVEEVDEITIYYCYSPKIKRQKVVKNQAVNLQIAVRESVVTLGSPIIYGSF